MIRTCLEYSCASSAERNRICVYKILAVYWQDDPNICTRLRMHRCINPYASHGQTSYHCQFVVPSIYLQSATANRCSIDRAAPGPVLRASPFQQAIDVPNLDYINVNRWYPNSVITDPHTCEINELLKVYRLSTSPYWPLHQKYGSFATYDELNQPYSIICTHCMLYLLICLKEVRFVAKQWMNNLTHHYQLACPPPSDPCSQAVPGDQIAPCAQTPCSTSMSLHLTLTKHPHDYLFCCTALVSQPSSACRAIATQPITTKASLSLSNWNSTATNRLLRIARN